MVDRKRLNANFSEPSEQRLTVVVGSFSGDFNRDGFVNSGDSLSPFIPLQ